MNDTTLPQADTSTYDNTALPKLPFEEHSLNRAIAQSQHDMDFPHEKEYWEDVLANPYGQNVRYRMWTTKSCGQPDCHHPIYSPMPI